MWSACSRWCEGQEERYNSAEGKLIDLTPIVSSVTNEHAQLIDAGVIILGKANLTVSRDHVYDEPCYALLLTLFSNSVA